MLIDAELIRIVLRVLYMSTGYALPQRHLATEANSLSTDPISSSDLKTTLNHMKEKGWIDYSVDEIDQARKWWITEAGTILYKKCRV